MKQSIGLQVIAVFVAGITLPCGICAAEQTQTAESLAVPARADIRTNALTLESAINLALANNPEMLAGSARVEAAQGRAEDAGLWSNPELTLAAEEIPVSGGSKEDSKDTIGVSQKVPYPGKKKLDRQIGASGVRTTQAELALRRRELVREVKAAFCRVLAADGSAGVGRKLMQVAEFSANAARKRVDAGAAPDQEKMRAEIQFDQARTELSGFEREAAIARQELATLLGLPALDESTVSGALIEQADKRLLDERPEQWLSRHPSAIAAQSVRDQTALELRRARLEPYPDVNLGVSGGREGPANTSIVEFRVGLPLPLIDRSKGRKREAEANLRVAQAQLAAIEQKLLRDWGIASKRLRTAAEQVATYRESILPKAERALRLVQTGFQEGKFGFIDLLDTQRTAAEAQLEFQQKLLELNLAQGELEALTGR